MPVWLVFHAMHLTCDTGRIFVCGILYLYLGNSIQCGVYSEICSTTEIFTKPNVYKARVAN